METLTFEQFQDQVMAALEDWPLRFKDLGDGDYQFYTVGGLGYEGSFINNQWGIYSYGLDKFANGETLESAIEQLEVN